MTGGAGRYRPTHHHVDPQTDANAPSSLPTSDAGSSYERGMLKRGYPLANVVMG